MISSVGAPSTTRLSHELRHKSRQHRHAKKPRFFAAGGNRLAARIELDEHILTDVFGLLFIRQIKIRHAQHVVRVLRIQLFELSLTIRRFHAAFQPFHFLPSDIKTNEPAVFIR